MPSLIVLKTETNITKSVSFILASLLLVLALGVHMIALWDKTIILDTNGVLFQIFYKNNEKHKVW